MNFLWPSAFLLLGLVPLMLAAYLWRQRRRRRYAIRYSSLSLVRLAVPAQSRLRRYLPLALFCLALASLVFSLARPVAVTLVPAGRATVMLALDVSRSMIQDDIPPSRLGAAKQAALSFIQRQRADNQIGVVAFAGIAQLVQPPSTDPAELERAILLLTTGRGTAIGSGILTALDALDEFSQSEAANSGQAQTPGQASPGAASPGEEIAYQPDIIVLLTDGVTTTGPDPLEAAQAAVDRGVRVYTIGFGTQNGSMGQGGGFYGGGFGGFGGFRRRGIDEATLKAIAARTGGEYYSASSAGELQKVFDSLPTFLITRRETVEISVIFAALAALLVIGAVLLAQLWRPLP
jgi:Ca-activated chloride channel homolog